MSGYISEFTYYGESPLEFVEVALPDGTDPSGYKIYIYNGNGNVSKSFNIGAASGTMAGHDVYVVDQSTPGWATSNSTGNLSPNSSIALVDGNGNTVQFLSYWGVETTAQNGPAAGHTSRDVGGSKYGESMQSDDGGKTYFAQTSPNKGTIPACYARDTVIASPMGDILVQDVRAGDCLTTANGGSCVVLWVWSGTQALDDIAPHQKPVLISCGALGPGVPSRDLVVSGQHRMVVGLPDQLPQIADGPVFVPAKALTGLPGIRHMHGKRAIRWYHFVCANHQVVIANGAATESMLPGPAILATLDAGQRGSVLAATGQTTGSADLVAAYSCLSVGETRARLSRAGHAAATAAFVAINAL